MPMNSKWWKTILIESILSGAIWVVATCWPVDWRKANWKLMKTHWYWYIMIHCYTSMESKHADANRIFSLPGWFHVTQKAQTAFGWSGWSLLIWSMGSKMKPDETKFCISCHAMCLGDVAGSLVQRICLGISRPNHATDSVSWLLPSPNLSPSSNKSEEQAGITDESVCVELNTFK